MQLIKLSPASLAKWYKPQSERHIWLHNMFSLRREIQAVEYYADTGQVNLLAEWTNGLNLALQNSRAVRWVRSQSPLALNVTARTDWL